MLYKFIDVTFWKTHIIHSIFLSFSIPAWHIAYISKSEPKQNTFHVSISLQMFTDCVICYPMESVLLHGIFYSHRNVIRFILCMCFNGLDLGKEVEYFTPYWKLHSEKKEGKNVHVDISFLAHKLVNVI